MVKLQWRNPDIKVVQTLWNMEHLLLENNLHEVILSNVYYFLITFIDNLGPLPLIYQFN